ncbi:piwi domain-containing protein [Colletotrichum karsti]|uniref:Piwi domain-containing protein n=1 Tax=Colletotrichum karsti TaxID=1095194 RepID=A0A9P6LL99_9PEZI|nr:piwi domain-containing protein [Colletotrichum karsti]KAF9876347.1 piwi domain-containing protein [Colletotrichum karsti]
MTSDVDSIEPAPIAPGDHKGYLEYALSLAKQSPPKPSNYRVGAVLVNPASNSVVSTGYTLELPGNTHAEQCCFMKLAEEYEVAEEELGDVIKTPLVLYTTMEPCSVRLSGNLPCTKRILQLRSIIKAVYVGVQEPEKFVKDNTGRTALERAGIDFFHIKGLYTSTFALEEHLLYPRAIPWDTALFLSDFAITFGLFAVAVVETADEVIGAAEAVIAVVAAAVEASVEIAAAAAAALEETAAAVAAVIAEAEAAVIAEAEAVASTVAEAVVVLIVAEVVTVGVAVAEEVVAAVSAGSHSRAKPTRSSGNQGQAVPQPDAQVTQLENQIIQGHQSKDMALVKKMSGMKLTEGNANALMPRRPAYGTKGKAIIVWANYFKLDVKPKVLYRYNLEVRKGEKDDDEAPEVDPKGKGKAKAGGGGGDGPAATIPARKLKLILQLAIDELKKLEPNAILATEFKSQLVSLTKLKLDKNPIIVKFKSETSGREDIYNVKIVGETEAPLEALAKYLQTMIDTSDPDEENFPRFATSVDALGVVLGFTPRLKDSVTAIGKGRFFPWGPGTAHAQLGHENPLTAIRGFFQSVRLGTGRVLLNVNVTHGVFKTSVKISDLCRWFGVNVFGTGSSTNSNNARSYLRILSKFLARTRCEIEYLNSKGELVRSKKAIQGLACKHDLSRPPVDTTVFFANGFHYGGPQEVSFKMDPEEGQKTVLGNKPPGNYTIAQYWQWKYKQVPDKSMPLVNVGTAARPLFFPAERCTIVAGQPVRSKLTGDETTVMLDFACRSPFANAVSLTVDSAQALGYDQPLLQNFGLSVDRRLLSVSGRELMPPTVTYGNAKTLQTRAGSWNMSGVKVAKPGPRITSWNWVRIIEEGRTPHVSTQVAGQSVQQFVQFLNTSGIAIDTQVPNTPHEITVQRGREKEDIKAAFQRYNEHVMANKGTTKNFFMLVILPRQDTTIYGAVKSVGDTIFGFHTVCSVEKTFFKNNLQTFANIGLKWNLKNGGNNHLVKDSIDIITSGKTMIVGYDVTHPTNMPNDKNAAPSLVGLVASVDKELGQWPACAWEQGSRQEMLGEELVDAFKSRLTLWRSRNAGKLPEFIVIYRDGVSEGQFTQVLTVELPLIRKACSQLYPPNQRPKLSIIVSVKRHQTRFYPTSEQNMDQKSRNIKNGTVVDRGITQARYWDFFLTAHTALKGTARPAHYTVLMDEIFREKYGVGAQAADQLEKLTHNLCYLFGRATKAVSICPPAYYADIVCDRARVHRPELYDISDTESVSTASRAVSVATIQVHDNLRDTMYYI